MKSLILLLIVLPAVPPLYAQPWRKPSAKWSDKDARQVLFNSPWAKRATLQTTTAVAKAGARSAGHNSITQAEIAVRWDSALPVKEALIKLGVMPAVNKDSRYAIAVLGVAKSWSGPTPEATLQYTGGPPVMAVEVLFVEQREAPLIVFLFPKTAEIRDPGVFRIPFGLQFKPNEFLFAARIGHSELKQRFHLKDMLYLWKLEL